MIWRDPKKELPKEGDVCWLMLKPHKDRITSVQIVCCEIWEAPNGCVYGENEADELGAGCVCHYLTEPEEDDIYHQQDVAAWIPVAEMPIPKWLNRL